MGFFKSEEEFYEIQRPLFEQLISHPDMGPALSQSRLVVAFKVSQPDGLITLDCRDFPSAAGKYFSYSFGPSSLKPDVTLTMAADLIHQFWQGKLNIISALLSGKVKAEGNITQAMKLMPSLKSIFELYPQTLKEMGREDLIIK